MHDAREYRTCLQQVARLLALRGELAAHYDRYALLLLRGDCLLHLEDRATALEAYTEAMTSPEPRQLAEARAMTRLIAGSTGLAFNPKFPPDAPAIDIVDHQGRKKAMLALMEQLQFENKAAIDAALAARTLVPIIHAAPALLDIHALEVAATGSDAKIHPTLAAIGKRARELMSSELTEVEQRVSRIERMAGQPSGIAVGGMWWGGTARRGLTTDDRAALRRDAAYTDQITSAANEFQRISRSLGGTGEKWEPIVNRGVEVANHARDVLAAE
jgi:hypothetical protein